MTSRLSEPTDMVNLNFTSWNQMTAWLRELDALRLVALRRRFGNRDDHRLDHPGAFVRCVLTREDTTQTANPPTPSLWTETRDSWWHTLPGRRPPLSVLRPICIRRSVRRKRRSSVPRFVGEHGERAVVDSRASAGLLAIAVTPSLPNSETAPIRWNRTPDSVR